SWSESLGPPGPRSKFSQSFASHRVLWFTSVLEKKTQGRFRPSKPSEHVPRKMLCGGISEQKCSLVTNFLATLIIRLSRPTAAGGLFTYSFAESILGGDLIA